MTDAAGYAFTFHIVSILTGVNIGAYVHCPTITTEMIRRVEWDLVLHTNTASASSTLVAQGKLLQVPLFVIRGKKREAYVCTVAGTIAHSYPSTGSLFVGRLSLWQAHRGQKRTSTRSCPTASLISYPTSHYRSSWGSHRSL